MSEPLFDLVETFCREAEIPCVREPDCVGIQVHGERKLVIGIVVTKVNAALRFETFFMRRPMEDEARFYAMLLGRNFRARCVAFCVDAIGDVYLVGCVPEASVTPEELDRVIGAFLVESDGMFDAAMQIGFASYLQSDLAWRAKQAGERG